VPTLPDHFSDLLSAIEPSEERMEDAKELPAQVREFLRECDKILTVWPHSRLAGSYARHTAGKCIKDVDIILVLDPDYQDEEPADVLATLFSALFGLPKALDDNGDVEAARRRQRRSIHVHLKHRDFRLDIVPALAPT
jgi:tRNA nucleotidyltransferase (CCA-adding enzyme)